MTKKYLKNKISIVTGSSKGIGFEIAKVLSSHGSFVEMSGSSDEPHSLIGPSNTNYTQVDFANADAVASYSEAILSHYNDIGILVNNAGIGDFKPFAEFSLEEYTRMMQINLHSAFQLTSNLMPLLESKGAIIVNVVSIAVPQTFKNSSVYAASKSALAKMFAVAREEFRSKNISVINVYPGATATEIWNADYLAANKSAMMSAKDVATAICSAIDQSLQGNIVTEELYLRPKNGDLR